MTVRTAALPTRSALTLLLFCLFGMVTPCTAQDQGAPKDPASDAIPEPPPPAADRSRTLIMGALTIDLPSAWRALTPNEALDLQDTAPFPLHEVRPGSYEIYGRVDDWLRKGFDGEALVIGRKDYERPVDDENLAELTEIANQTDPGGNRRTMTSGLIGTVGFFDHPAFLFEVAYETEKHGRFRLFETFASTAGDEYLIQHILDAERTDAAAEASTLRDTMRFVSRPKEPEELSDRLLDAALVGGGIGLVLIGLRALIRKPDPEPPGGGPAQTA